MKKELRALISLNLCFAMLLSLLSPMAAFAVDKKSTTSYAFVLESTMVEMNLAVGEVLEVKAIDTDGCLVVYTVHDTTLFDGYGHDGKCINTWLKIEDGMVTGIAENQMVVTDCGEISSTSCILYNGEVTATCGEETIFVIVTAEDCEAEGCATGEEIDSVDACGVGTRPCSVDVTGNVYALYDENKQVICALAAGALEEVSLVKTWYVGAEDETDAEAKLYSDGRMEITGKGAIKSFSHSGYDVTALFVGDGITNIPDYLLDNKKTLQFVKLGQNVQTVGYDAFGDCSNLTEVVFNEGLKRIEGYAFANTAIRHFATGDVTQIDYRAFANCSELQSVTVHGDLQSLGSDAFRNCVKLRNVSWKNDQCLNMSTGAFYNAGSEGAGITLTAYGSIPASLFYVSGNDIGENGEGVPHLKHIEYYGTQIGKQAFYNCRYLEEVNLGGEVTAIGDGAFNGCSNLTEIALLGDMQTIGRKAFFRSGLTSALISHSVSAIGEEAFAECDETLTMKGWAGSYAESYAIENNIPFTAVESSGTVSEEILWSFDDRSGVLTVSGSGDLGGKVTGERPWEAFADRIVEVRVEEGITSLRSSFNDLPALQSVYLPATLDAIHDDAFSGSDQLREVYFAGNPPELREGDDQFADHFLWVYYLHGTEGWEEVNWENCTFEPYYEETARVDLVLMDQHWRYKAGVGSEFALSDKREWAETTAAEYAPGAVLTGWNTEPDGSGVAYAVDAIFTVTEDLTLYAQWESGPMVTIDGMTFSALQSMQEVSWRYEPQIRYGQQDKNDGELWGWIEFDGYYSGGGIEAEVPLHIRVHSDVTVNGSIKTSADADIVVYNGSLLTVNSEGNPAVEGNNVSLTLKSGDVELNGGDALAVKAASLNTGGDGKLKIRSDGETAVEVTAAADFRMKGTTEITAQSVALSTGKLSYAAGLGIYNSKLALIGTDRYDGGAYLRIAVAMWQLILNANGGTWYDQEESEKSFIAEWNDEIYLGSSSENIYKDGYMLNGWRTEDGKVWYDNYDWVSSAPNLTLFADWQEIPLITIDGVSYNAMGSHETDEWTYTYSSNSRTTLRFFDDYNGGSIVSPYPLTIYLNGHDVTINGSLRMPADYGFANVQGNSDGASLTIRSEEGPALVAASYTIFGHGGTYDLSSSDGSPAVQVKNLATDDLGNLSVRSNGDVAVQASLGATFNMSGTTEIVAAKTAVSAPDVQIGSYQNIYNSKDAEKPAKKYDGGAYLRLEGTEWTVTLDANGGSWIDYSESAKTIPVMHNDGLYLREYKDSVVKEGSHLIGWNTKADGSGTAYDAIKDVIWAERDLTLYAQWEENPLLVIDGVSYDAMKDHKTNQWEYSFDGRWGHLAFTNESSYTCSGIESPYPLYINLIGRDVTVNGSIRMPTDTSVMGRLIVNNGSTLTVNATEGPALTAARCTIDVWNGKVVLSGGNDSPAVQAKLLRTNGDGELLIRSAGAVAVSVSEEVGFYMDGKIEIAAAETAVSTRTLQIQPQLEIYNDAAAAPAKRYDGGAYLRLESPKWTLTLDANNGVWADQDEAERSFTAYYHELINIGLVQNLLSREGYVFKFWSDADNTVEYDANAQVASAPELTLYATWEERTLIVDGVRYDVDAEASGDGWYYTPGDENAAPILELDGYQGGSIYANDGLTVTFFGDNRITGETGKPAIDGCGLLAVNEGATAIITGGSGAVAVQAGEDNFQIFNRGKLEIYGGAGGEALCAKGHIYIENEGLMTVVGGNAAYAATCRSMQFDGNGKTTLCSGALGWRAVNWSNGYGWSETMRFYGGDTAGTARQLDGESAMWCSYLRVQPKTIVVTMNANGGEVNGAAAYVKAYAHNDENQITLDKLATPVREGYAFRGWNSAADGSGTTYESSKTYTVAQTDGELQLYAQWDKIEYEIVSTNKLTIRIPEVPEGGSVMLVTYTAAGKMEKIYYGTLNAAGNWVFSVKAMPTSAVVKLLIYDSAFRPLKESILVK